MLEQFKPKPQRRYGFFAHPILMGDRFVGMLDAEVDREREVLRVNAVHEFLPFEPEEDEMVRAEIARARRVARRRACPKRADPREFFMRAASKPALRTEVLTAGRKEPPPKEDNVRKTIAAGVVAGFALAAGFVAPASAISATTADLYVLHGIPDTPVDV